MRIGGLVLAAGEGSRFGGTKQLAAVGGRPMLEHALASVAALSPRVVVLGHEADAILAAVDLQGARAVVCPEWEEGQAASLRCGVAALGDVDAAVVVLGDQPRITAGAVAAVAGAAEPGLAAALSGASSPLVIAAPLGAGAVEMRLWRHVEKSRMRRLEMSSIMPPRPKRASRPVIVKSVTAETRVTSPSEVSVLTIVALAPPWPRLSVPLARIVAVWVAASASSIFTVPL